MVGVHSVVEVGEDVRLCEMNIQRPNETALELTQWCAWRCGDRRKGDAAACSPEPWEIWLHPPDYDSH